MTIVRVTSGGIPVVESDRGLPYYEAENGYGIPVTFGSTGIPLGGTGWWSRPSNLLLGDDGDSRIDNGTGLTASQRYLFAIGFQAWGLSLGSNPALFRLESSYGTTGDTVALMNARRATTFADPAGAFIVLCGTNTFAGAGGDTQEVLDQAKIDMASYLDAAGAARKIIFLVGEMPRLTTDTPPGTISPAAYANLILFHQWLRDTAWVGRPWVRPVDFWSVMADGSDAPLPGMLRDGLHPTTLGAKTGGSPLLAALNNFYGSNSKFVEPVTDSSLYNASTNPSGCLVSNPLLTGTGGSPGSGLNGAGFVGSAVIASNWSVVRNSNASAMSFAISKDPTTDAQVLSWSGTPTNSGATLQIFQTINVANLSLNDILRGFAQVEQIGLTNVDRVNVEIVLTATQNCSARNMAATSGQVMTSDQVTKLLSPTEPITTGFSACQISIVVGFVQGAACSGTIKVSQATPRKVEA